ncbi:MAG: hypothetical protein AAFO29_16720 [Actinomycetota bacterium]
MRPLRHPSTKVLRAWLDGARPDLDEHLATCHRCATALEELDAPPTVPLAAALAEVFETPSDLTERLAQRVSDRLDSQVMLGVISDLFGAGLETSVLLMTEEPSDE